ncbi:MAG TPA: hypothetical protein VK338_05805 [Candidatus Nitrosocosmicus sp.]|nr:hypothetical protein [Candidatus Nitrosocosmicus sp.]
MKLTKLNYEEYVEDLKRNEWKLIDLSINTHSLIVGKNATGKSRTTNVIHNLAILINDSSKILDGKWDLEFRMKNEKVFTYFLVIKDQKVITEKITIDKETKLNRVGNETIIIANNSNSKTIHPPNDKLVLHIRRDEIEYPFFEELYNWSENTIAYRFDRLEAGTLILGENNNSKSLPALDLAPDTFDKLNKETALNVKEDFISIGYDIEKITTDALKGFPINAKILNITEKGIQFPLSQLELSRGMYTAFALLVNLHFFIQEKANQDITLIIDDLGANLDYERALKLAEVLFKKHAQRNLQIIATSNDRFLINAVDLKYLNILKRENNIVSSFNYLNSKDVFEKFELTGFNNFDLFTSDFITKYK